MCWWMMTCVVFVTPLTGASTTLAARGQLRRQWKITFPPSAGRLDTDGSVRSHCPSLLRQSLCSHATPRPQPLPHISHPQRTPTRPRPGQQQWLSEPGYSVTKKSPVRKSSVCVTSGSFWWERLKQFRLWLQLTLNRRAKPLHSLSCADSALSIND